MKSSPHPLWPLLCGLMVAANAGAFYNPSAGRWLNRDPIGERGGVNLYSFVAGNAISHVENLGREFVDNGYVTSFSGGAGNMAITQTTPPALEAACLCVNSVVCRLKYKSVRMESQSFIGLYEAGSIETAPPFRRCSAAQISANIVHENKHRQRDKEWHDQNVAGMVSDLSQLVPCATCTEQVGVIQDRWGTQWSAFSRGEFAHSNPGWEGFEENPPQFDSDSGVWWTGEIPVDKMVGDFADPLGVF